MTETTARERPTCPHPRETWVREEALYSSRCPECKARVCTSCRRYGWKGAMLPLVSWMTGTCDSCYADTQRRRKIRDSYESERRHREDRQRVWEAGRTAAPDAGNPYAAPDYYEQRLLDEHDWLREEASR